MQSNRRETSANRNPMGSTQKTGRSPHRPKKIGDDDNSRGALTTATSYDSRYVYDVTDGNYADTTTTTGNTSCTQSSKTMGLFSERVIRTRRDNRYGNNSIFSKELLSGRQWLRFSKEEEEKKFSSVENFNGTEAAAKEEGKGGSSRSNTRTGGSPKQKGLSCVQGLGGSAELKPSPQAEALRAQTNDSSQKAVLRPRPPQPPPLPNNAVSSAAPSLHVFLDKTHENGGASGGPTVATESAKKYNDIRKRNSLLSGANQIFSLTSPSPPSATDVSPRGGGSDIRLRRLSYSYNTRQGVAGTTLARSGEQSKLRPDAIAQGAAPARPQTTHGSPNPKSLREVSPQRDKGKAGQPQRASSASTGFVDKSKQQQRQYQSALHSTNGKAVVSGSSLSHEMKAIYHAALLKRREAHLELEAVARGGPHLRRSADGSGGDLHQGPTERATTTKGPATNIIATPSRQLSHTNNNNTYDTTIDKGEDEETAAVDVEADHSPLSLKLESTRPDLVFGGRALVTLAHLKERVDAKVHLAKTNPEIHDYITTSAREAKRLRAEEYRRRDHVARRVDDALRRFTVAWAAVHGLQEHEHLLAMGQLPTSQLANDDCGVGGGGLFSEGEEGGLWDDGQLRDLLSDEELLSVKPIYKKLRKKKKSNSVHMRNALLGGGDEKGEHSHEDPSSEGESPPPQSPTSSDGAGEQKQSASAATAAKITAVGIGVNVAGTNTTSTLLDDDEQFPCIPAYAIEKVRHVAYQLAVKHLEDAYINTAEYARKRNEERRAVHAERLVVVNKAKEERVLDLVTRHDRTVAAAEEERRRQRHNPLKAEWMKLICFALMQTHLQNRGLKMIACKHVQYHRDMLVTWFHRWHDPTQRLLIVKKKRLARAKVFLALIIARMWGYIAVRRRQALTIRQYLRDVKEAGRLQVGVHRYLQSIGKCVGAVRRFLIVRSYSLRLAYLQYLRAEKVFLIEKEAEMIETDAKRFAEEELASKSRSSRKVKALEREARKSLTREQQTLFRVDDLVSRDRTNYTVAGGFHFPFGIVAPLLIDAWRKQRRHFLFVEQPKLHAADLAKHKMMLVERASFTPSEAAKAPALPRNGAPPPPRPCPRLLRTEVVDWIVRSAHEMYEDAALRIRREAAIQAVAENMDCNYPMLRDKMLKDHFGGSCFELWQRSAVYRHAFADMGPLLLSSQSSSSSRAMMGTGLPEGRGGYGTASTKSPSPTSLKLMSSPMVGTPRSGGGGAGVGKSGGEKVQSQRRATLLMMGSSSLSQQGFNSKRAANGSSNGDVATQQKARRNSPSQSPTGGRNSLSPSTPAAEGGTLTNSPFGASLPSSSSVTTAFDTSGRHGGRSPAPLRAHNVSRQFTGGAPLGISPATRELLRDRGGLL